MSRAEQPGDPGSNSPAQVAPVCSLLEHLMSSKLNGIHKKRERTVFNPTSCLFPCAWRKHFSLEMGLVALGKLLIRVVTASEQSQALTRMPCPTRPFQRAVEPFLGLCLICTRGFVAKFPKPWAKVLMVTQPSHFNVPGHFSRETLGFFQGSCAPLVAYLAYTSHNISSTYQPPLSALIPGCLM